MNEVTSAGPGLHYEIKCVDCGTGDVGTTRWYYRMLVDHAGSCDNVIHIRVRELHFN